MPPSGGFTSSVTGCNNTFYGGDSHFGENFACYGPCVDSDPDEYYDEFTLSKFLTSGLPYRSSLYLSTCAITDVCLTDSIIGNDDGILTC